MNVIQNLIDAFSLLPGIGKKTAQRLSYHILERGKNSGLKLAEALKEAISTVKYCDRCHNLCNSDLCDICRDKTRNQKLLCIVETPADVMAIEQTASYHGLYFVLMGRLCPLDGIGPKEIGIDALRALFLEETSVISEVVIATNSTVESEITANYINNVIKDLKPNITITRLAHGIPIGSELEYLDKNTLTCALNARRDFNEKIAE